MLTADEFISIDSPASPWSTSDGSDTYSERAPSSHRIAFPVQKWTNPRLNVNKRKLDDEGIESGEAETNKEQEQVPAAINVVVENRPSQQALVPLPSNANRFPQYPNDHDQRYRNSRDSRSSPPKKPRTERDNSNVTVQIGGERQQQPSRDQQPGSTSLDNNQLAQSLVKTFTDLQNEKKKLAAETVELRRENDHLRQENERLRQERDAAWTATLEKTDQLAKLEKLHESRLQLLTNLTKDFTKVQGELAAAKDWEKKMSALNQTKDQASSENAALKRDLLAMRTELAAKHDEFNKSLAKKQGELVAANKALEVIKRQLQEAATTPAAAQKELESVKAQLQASRAALEKAKTEFASKEATAKQQYNKLNTKHSLSSSKAKTLAEEVTRLEKKLAQTPEKTKMFAAVLESAMPSAAPGPHEPALLSEAELASLVKFAEDFGSERVRAWIGSVNSEVLRMRRNWSLMKEGVAGGDKGAGKAVTIKKER